MHSFCTIRGAQENEAFGTVFDLFHFILGGWLAEIILEKPPWHMQILGTVNLVSPTVGRHRVVMMAAANEREKLGTVGLVTRCAGS